MRSARQKPDLRNAGFTLLELLVALAIFAFVGAMAMGGLNSVIKQRDRTKKAMERFKSVQQGITILTRDLEQASPRPVRESLGNQSVGAFLGSDENLPTLQLTRAGWRNPLDETRSTLERVAYRIEDDKLVRLSWPVLDRTQNTQPVRQTLIADATRLQVRFMAANGEWQNQWPPLNSTANQFDNRLPKAVEISLDLEDMGRITRLFEVAGRAPPASTVANAPTAPQPGS